MSWNAIITGELKFPVGHIDKWLAAAGVLPRHAWPEFLAGTVDEDFDEEEDDAHLLTVAGRICTQQILCGGSFIADTIGDEVRLRAVVGKDEFGGAVNEVVRMVGATLPLGGSGQVVLRYAGGGWGHDDGAILRFAKGALATERIPSGGAALAAEDFAVMEEVQARAPQVEAAALAMRKEKVLARKSAPPKKKAPKKRAPKKKARKK